MKHKAHRPSLFVQLMGKATVALPTFIILTLLLGGAAVYFTTTFPTYGSIKTVTYTIPDFPPTEKVHIVASVDNGLIVREQTTKELLEGNFKFFGVVRLSGYYYEQKNDKPAIVLDLYRADPSLRVVKITLDNLPENPPWGYYDFVSYGGYPPTYQEGKISINFQLKASVSAFFITALALVVIGFFAGFIAFYFCRKSLNDHGIRD